MSTTAEQHAEHLDAEQAEGDLAEGLANDFDPPVGTRRVMFRCVAEWVGECTCVAAGLSAAETGGHHENGCGWDYVATCDPAAPEPPLTPEDEERLAALALLRPACGRPAWRYPNTDPIPEPCALEADHEEPCEP